MIILRKRKTLGEGVEQEDGGGGVGIAEPSDVKKGAKKEQKKQSHPSDWNRLFADTKFVQADGDVNLAAFSEVQVRHGPQVEQYRK